MRQSVLFIGNSFTARNDLPVLVAALAEASGDHLDHRLIQQGGASLRMHWNKGVAPSVIRTDKFDYVVLQEQSTLPVKSPKRFHENVRLFDEAIRKAGSKTALYMTWARAHAPQTQQGITDAYTSIARELDATLIPAGIAWERFLREHPTPVLHDRDGSHPTIAGSFLAACVMFAVLFHRSSAKLTPPVKGLSEQDIKLLAATAAAVVAS